MKSKRTIDMRRKMEKKMNKAAAEQQVEVLDKHKPNNHPDEARAFVNAEKNRQDAEFILKNPVFLEVSEPIRKMRSNLMIVSVVAIFSISMGLGVAATSSISGIQFTGLTDTKISTGLLLVTSYMLIHFVWSSWDGFQEWRVRCSGVALAFPDVHGLKDADPRQVSLMTWWTAQVNNLANTQDSARRSLELFEKTIETLDLNPDVAKEANRKAGHDMIANFLAYSSSMMQLYKMGVSEANEKNLREQLGRFELIFKRFQVSQNWRWIIVEFLIPVVLGTVAIGVLLTDLNLNPLFSFAII